MQVGVGVRLRLGSGSMSNNFQRGVEVEVGNSFLTPYLIEIFSVLASIY